MNELKQKLKDFEAELSKMVMEFHTANNIEPMVYKITPLFSENKRAIGEQYIFIKHDLDTEFSRYNTQDFSTLFFNRLTEFLRTRDIQKAFRENLLLNIRLFCSDNKITYVKGKISYVATHENKLLQVYTDLLVKP